MYNFSKIYYLVFIVLKYKCMFYFSFEDGVNSNWLQSEIEGTDKVGVVLPAFGYYKFIHIAKKKVIPEQ